MKKEGILFCKANSGQLWSFNVNRLQGHVEEFGSKSISSRLHTLLYCLQPCYLTRRYSSRSPASRERKDACCRYALLIVHYVYKAVSPEVKVTRRYLRSYPLHRRLPGQRLQALCASICASSGRPAPLPPGGKGKSNSQTNVTAC